MTDAGVLPPVLFLAALGLSVFSLAWTALALAVRRAGSPPLGDLAAQNQKLLITCLALFLLGLLKGVFWALCLAAIPPAALAASRAAAGAARRRKLSEQLPPFLDRLASSLRTGMGLEAALAETAEEAENPLRAELQQTLQEIKMGLTLAEALESLARRVPLADMRLTATAIPLAQEAGASLGQTLETIADTVRARQKLDGKLRAMTAQGKMQAAIVGAIPFALLAFLWIWEPGMVERFLASPGGRWTIAGAACLELVGILWIWKIVTPEERP